MSDPGRPIAQEELHAWMDGQLDADRQQAVSRYLQDHPDVARRVAGWREQRDALRAAFASVAAKPIPSRLQIDRLIRHHLTRRAVVWRTAATALLAFGLGGAAGWFLHNGLQPPGPAAITLLAQRRYPITSSTPLTVAARLNLAHSSGTTWRVGCRTG